MSNRTAALVARTLAAGALLAGAACIAQDGGDTGKPAIEAQKQPGVILGPDGTPCLTDAKYFVSATINSDTPTGPSKSKLLMLADLHVQGNQVMADTRLCSVNLPVPSGVKYKFKKGALETLRATVVFNVGPASSGTCATLQTAAPVVLVAGARLRDPMNEPLPVPQSPACSGALASCTPAGPPQDGPSCICDQDGDGIPGVTIDFTKLPLVDSLTVFGAFRAAIQLMGGVKGPKKLEGMISSTLNLSALGCQMGGQPCPDNIFQLVVQQANQPSMQSQSKPSTWLATPASAKADCAAAQANEVFGGL
jgi:hypothetical protein